jgi:hypothetical protein
VYNICTHLYDINFNRLLLLAGDIHSPILPHQLPIHGEHTMSDAHAVALAKHDRRPLIDHLIRVYSYTSLTHAPTYLNDETERISVRAISVGATAACLLIAVRVVDESASAVDDE